MTLLPELTKIDQLPINGPAVIWFSATWCGPCKQVDTVTLAARSAELSVPVFHCDIDDCPDIADTFVVKTIPTFVAVRNGKATGTKTTGPSTTSWLRLLKGLAA